jgi:helix-turn-helix protein
VCFINGKIDDRVEKDSTLLEIVDEIKILIYKGLKNLLLITFIGITLDLLFLYLNPILFT